MTKKTTVAAATLVAAVPATALGILLVLTFLTRLGDLKGMYLALYSVTLLLCALVIFLPMAIMIFGPRDARTSEPKPEATPQAAKKPAANEEKAKKGTEVLDDGAGTQPFSTGELEVVEGSATYDDLDAVDAPFSDSQLESVEHDDFFDVEEEPPKKPKRR